MITDWADQPLSYFADHAGIPVSQYVPETVSEYYATGLETLANLFTKDWFNWAVKLGTGFIAGAAVIWGNLKDQRLKMELLPIANHLLARILTMTPVESRNFQVTFTTTWNALLRGDWAAVLASITRSPTEFMVYFGLVPRSNLPPVTNGGGATSVTITNTSGTRPVTTRMPTTIDVEAPMGNHVMGRYTISM